MTRVFRIATNSCLAILLASLATCSFADSADNRPNIVFILADDLGYGDIGCFGQRRFETPQIDRLAASGMRLIQHYAGSTVCASSRCSLMTGLHTGHCFIRGNREHFPTGQQPLPASAVTIAELLHDAGYATGAFGKWGLGYLGSEGDPLSQGFDEFYGYHCQREAHRYFPKSLMHNRDTIELDGKTYTHDLIIDRALDFIRRHRQAPFFCYLPVTIPHVALELPEEYKRPFRERFPEFENVVGRYAGAEYTNPAAAFAAMMTRLDTDVGRIIDLLHDLGIEKNTLVIFTSDNGPEREGGHDPDYFRSAGPFRGLKRDLYEGGIRVPTVVAFPGTISPGGVSDHVSANWDWFPTLCELAGIETGIPQNDGVSLVPTLLGKPGQKSHDVLYWEFHERGGKLSIRVNDWKAVRLNVGADPNGPLELYDLASDPGESRNVAAEHPDVVQKLAARMANSRTPSRLFRFGVKAE